MKKFLCYDTNDAASGKINVNSNGILKPNSTLPSTNGSANQQLVTDSFGNVKWDERLAYEKSRIVADYGDGLKYVKVADDVPDWVSEGVEVTLGLPNGITITSNLQRPIPNIECYADEFGPPYVMFLSNEGFYVFPEKGVYFIKDLAEGEDSYLESVAPTTDASAKITWDGSFREVKKIDEKFLPKQPEQAELPVFTVKKVGVAVSINYLFDAEGDLMTAEQANSIGLNFVVQTDEGITKPISMVRFDDYVCFYIPQVGEGTLNCISCYTEGYSVVV